MCSCVSWWKAMWLNRSAISGYWWIDSTMYVWYMLIKIYLPHTVLTYTSSPLMDQLVVPGWPQYECVTGSSYTTHRLQEFLAALSVVHRDLACRNVLVADRKVLKISDFGLSKNTDLYVSSLSGKLPIRWMAPESIRERVFTEKSDVWVNWKSNIIHTWHACVQYCISPLLCTTGGLTE